MAKGLNTGNSSTAYTHTHFPQRQGSGDRGTSSSRSQVVHQPVVLVATHSKVGVVGEVDHVRWAHIHRVPQGAVRPTGVGQDSGRVTGDV